MSAVSDGGLPGYHLNDVFTRYVVKLPLFDLIIMTDNDDDIRTEHLTEAWRTVAEQRYLKMFKECPTIVSEATGFGTPAWAILLEDAGIGLDQFIVSGNAGKELALLSRLLKEKKYVMLISTRATFVYTHPRMTN